MAAAHLRRATEVDIEFLADVVLLANEDRYRQRADWDRKSFRAGLVEDAADQVAGGVEHSNTYVIVVDGVDVGRARLIRTAEQIEIAGLQVLPAYQNRGTGTAVVSQVIAEAAGARTPVVLDVETDNPRARQLYRRLGFSETGPAVKDRQPMLLRTDKAPIEEWMRVELVNLSTPPTGPMTVISDQAWGTVWRVPTAGASVIVKQSAAGRRRECEIVALAARLAPDQVDAPLAADPATGRMILPDTGPTLYAANPATRGIDLDTVLALLADVARFQQATMGHDCEAAGVPQWDPGLAADDAAQQADSLHELPPDDPRHITAEQLGRIRASLPDIARAGRHVADSPIPHCLDHGDIFPGNLIRADGRFRFIDFGDAAWTHPFLSLMMPVVECRFHWSVPDRADGLNLDHPVVRQILDSYLGAWTGYAAMPDLRETLRHALRIAPLRRSRAWITNLAGADAETLAQRGGMPWAWLADVTMPVLL